MSPFSYGGGRVHCADWTPVDDCHCCDGPRQGRQTRLDGARQVGQLSIRAVVEPAHRSWHVAVAAVQPAALDELPGLAVVVLVLEADRTWVRRVGVGITVVRSQPSVGDVTVTVYACASRCVILTICGPLFKFFCLTVRVFYRLLVDRSCTWSHERPAVTRQWRKSTSG